MVPPDVPVTSISRIGNVAAVLAALRDSVLVPAVPLGRILAETPSGKPVGAVNVTAPWKPFCGVTVIVPVAFEPWFI